MLSHYSSHSDTESKNDHDLLQLESPTIAKSFIVLSASTTRMLKDGSYLESGCIHHMRADSNILVAQYWIYVWILNCGLPQVVAVQQGTAIGARCGRRGQLTALRQLARHYIRSCCEAFFDSTPSFNCCSRRLGDTSLRCKLRIPTPRNHLHATA